MASPRIVTRTRESRKVSYSRQVCVVCSHPFKFGNTAAAIHDTILTCLRVFVLRIHQKIKGPENQIVFLLCHYFQFRMERDDSAIEKLFYRAVRVLSLLSGGGGEQVEPKRPISQNITQTDVLTLYGFLSIFLCLPFICVSRFIETSRRRGLHGGGARCFPHRPKEQMVPPFSNSFFFELGAVHFRRLMADYMAGWHGKKIVASLATRHNKSISAKLPVSCHAFPAHLERSSRSSPTSTPSFDKKRTLFSWVNYFLNPQEQCCGFYGLRELRTHSS